MEGEGAAETPAGNGNGEDHENGGTGAVDNGEAGKATNVEVTPPLVELPPGRVGTPAPPP